MDRGLAYGDGVFRTFPARNGIPAHWRRQYGKLSFDCSVLGIPPPSEAALRQEVDRVCAQETECVVKIIVTRGAGERGYKPGAGQPTRIVSGSASPATRPWLAEGVRVRMCRVRLGDQPALAGVKHLNRLENVLARSEWTDSGIAEGLLCDAAGRLIGGTMSNVFVVRDGQLATPDLSRCGVAGVTRDRVLEAAHRAGVACEIRAIPAAEIEHADEMFAVNSVIGVWPVKAVDSLSLPVGEITRRVTQWLEEDRDAALA